MVVKAATARNPVLGLCMMLGRIVCGTRKMEMVARIGGNDDENRK